MSRSPVHSTGDRSSEGGRGGPEIPAPVIDALGKTRPWVRVVVVMFVVALVVAAAALVAALQLGKGRSRVFAFISFLPFLTVLVAYSPAMIFLRRYLRGIKRVQAGEGLSALEDALGSQKSFWKYVAVLNVVLTIAYFVSVLGTGTVGRILRGH